MVTNKRYEAVYEALGHGPVNVSAMAEMLNYHFPHTTFFRAKPYNSLREWARMGWPTWADKSPVIALIASGESEAPDAGHWIAVQDGKAFDPSNEKPVVLRRYDRLDWWAVYFAARSAT